MRDRGRGVIGGLCLEGRHRRHRRDVRHGGHLLRQAVFHRQGGHLLRQAVFHRQGGSLRQGFGHRCSLRCQAVFHRQEGRLNIRRFRLIPSGSRGRSRLFIDDTQDFSQTPVAIGQVRFIRLYLTDEFFQSRIVMDGLIDFRITAGPVRAQANQFGHILVGGDQLTGPADDIVFIIAVAGGHGPGHAAQYINWRIAAALGNRPVQNDMAVEDTAHRIRHRFVVVVAFDKHGKEAGNGALAFRARTGPFQKLRQF